MKSSLEIFSMITPRAMTQNIGLNKKMDKNAIKYPVSKAKSSSKKYDEF